MKIIYVCLLLLIAACSKEDTVINQPEYQVKKSSKMAKILNAYGADHTAAMIKSRADIPTPENMVINGSTVECYNIDIDQVSAALGSGASDIVGLCTSSLINKWANFSPVILSRDPSDQVVATTRTPYSLDDFAGYNHQAKPPVYISNPVPATIYAEMYQTNQVIIELEKGEREPISGEDKNNVEIEFQLGGSSTKVYKSLLPGSGSYYYYFNTPDSEKTLYVIPCYVRYEADAWVQSNIIEEGGKAITVIPTPLAIQGSFSDIPTQYGAYSAINNIAFSVTRTSASPINLYFRLRVDAVGLRNGYGISYIGLPNGYKSFAGAESYNGTTSVEIYNDNTAVVGANVQLQVSPTIDFASFVILDAKSFTWDCTGGIE